MAIFKKKSQGKKKSCEDSVIQNQQSAGILVIRTNHRPFYDSQWRVITPKFAVTITRLDEEVAEDLLEEVIKLPEITEEQILSLDKRNQIYYD